MAYNIECVIIDINMPVLNGRAATKIIKRGNPHIKVIVISMQCDAVVVNKILKVGVGAFIKKDTDTA